MKYTNTELAREEFSRLLRTVDRAKSTDDAEHNRKAAEDALNFISSLAGDQIAKWLMHEAQQPLPDTEHIQSDEGTKVGSDDYAKRGLAWFVMGVSDVLAAASMHPEVLVRDLVEMSRNGGSGPAILTAATKGKGHKDNRDLKFSARKRVVYAVHHESGRTEQSPRKTRYRLNNTLDSSKSAEDKAWTRMVQPIPKGERNKILEIGKSATAPCPDADPKKFQELWAMAIS